jgi:ABC-type nitrate/sulfonate/bicarbonate transport system ATPase subunit
MIGVHGVHLHYGEGHQRKQVLQDVSFVVEKQSSCAVIGPSGCGKTSLLFLLAGLLMPNQGKVQIEGSPRCGTILQNYGLFPWKTVQENIGLGLQLQGQGRQARRAAIASLIKDMDLRGFEHHFPIQLSGGMQQRVALARTLAIEPQILLMDEPLSSLDALTRERLQNLILDIWRQKQITMVLVTHSIEEAVFLGQKIIILDQRPTRVLATIDNPAAGDPEYRQSDSYFHRCNTVRKILGGANGTQA